MTSDQTTVGGRYELGDLLGRGGMAEVRRAVDTRLGRQVAVKQLRTDLATDPTFQARFRREAQSAAGLNHPTIVAVYDTGEETDPITGVSIPYIVMELVEGQTLREVLRDGRKILPERALELTQGVLDALSYSHKAGIVHRDIKPANVMLTAQRRGQGDGLRYRPGGGRHLGDDDPDRSGDRYGAVPLAGAGPRRDRRRPLRRLLGRLSAVRAAGRPTAVHRRLPGQRGVPARPGEPGAAESARLDGHAGDRRDRAEVAGQGPRRPVPVRAGDEGRHRPGAGRRADHGHGAAGRARGADPDPDRGAGTARAAGPAARTRAGRGGAQASRRSRHRDRSADRGAARRRRVRDLPVAAAHPAAGPDPGRGAERRHLHRGAGQAAADHRRTGDQGRRRERRRDGPRTRSPSRTRPTARRSS